MVKQERQSGKDAALHHLYPSLRRDIQRRLTFIDTKGSPYDAAARADISRMLQVPGGAGINGMRNYIDKSLLPTPERPPESYTSQEVAAKAMNTDMIEAIALAYGAQRLAVDQLGTEAALQASQRFSTFVLDRAATLFGMRNPIVAEMGDYIGNMQEYFNTGDESDVRLASVVSVYSGSIATSASLRAHIESLTDDSPESENDDFEKARELMRANNDLFAATNDLRRYPVRSAIIPGINDGLISEWQVESVSVLADHLTEGDDPDNRTMFEEGKLVAFYGTSEPQGERLFDYHDDGLIRAVQNQTDGLSFFITLTESGQLTTLYGSDIRRLVQAGELSPLAYQKLRAEALVLYTDLVTPVWVQAKAQESANMVAAGGLGERKESAEGPERALVLAHRRILTEEMDQITRELEGELTEATDQAQTDSGTARAYKGRTGHIRRLPLNARASAWALENAHRDRVEVPEGYTYHKDTTKEGEARRAAITSHAEGTETVIALGNLKDRS